MRVASAAAVIGGIGAYLANGSNDAASPWLALVGASVAGLAVVAGPLPLLLAAALAVPAAWGDAVGAVAATVAVVAALFNVHDRRLVPARAIVGIGLAVAIGRLSWPGWTGGTALVAAIVVALVVTSGVARLPSGPRRHLLVGAGVVGAGLFVVGAAAAFTTMLQRTHLERAVDAIEAGLDATEEGDSVAAARHLKTAAASFGAVDTSLAAPWVRLGESIPVFGDQIAALDGLVGAAAAAAEVGADAAASADPESLRPVDGQVDLAQISEVGDQVVRARAALVDIGAAIDDADSPWLLPAIDDELADVRRRSVDAIADADAALEALDVVPALLGADGERRWLLVIQTPSELRGAGGLPGNFGVLRTDQGRVELERFGRISDIGEPADHADVPVEGPADYLARYSALYALDLYFQNSTVSAHFPSVAESMTARFQRVTGVAVDGAISMDPSAFAALLGLIGPVEVEGWDGPIDESNAEQVLLHDQYQRLGGAQDARIELLDTLAHDVFDRVIGGDLPGPAEVGRALSPEVAQRHIQLWSRRPEEQRWFGAIGATGSMAPVRSDALAVITTNASETKIDWYLRRDIAYDVRTAADGTVEATVRVRLRNDAPTTGPWYVIGPSPYIDVTPGVNRTRLAVFTPLALVSATVDGQPTVVPPTPGEQGRNASDLYLDVPPGGTVEVVLELAGTVRTPYLLDLHQQPVVNRDTVHVTVDGEVLFDGEQVTDLVLRPS